MGEQWITDFTNDDDTPPSHDQCAELEEAKITELMESFMSKTKPLSRVKDYIPEKADKLQALLDMRRGYLYKRFANVVEALEDTAAGMLSFCTISLESKEAELKELFPIKESKVAEEIQELRDELNKWISNGFPDGVEGLDAYDDYLPDGIPSFAAFKEAVSLKEEELTALNSEAIATKLQETRDFSKREVKEKVNAAIAAAVAAVEEDLSDDMLPYLDESSMAEFRAELISASKEYGCSRLDE